MLGLIFQTGLDYQPFELTVWTVKGVASKLVGSALVGRAKGRGGVTRSVPFAIVAFHGGLHLSRSFGAHDCVEENLVTLRPFTGVVQCSTDFWTQSMAESTNHHGLSRCREMVVLLELGLELL